MDNFWADVSANTQIIKGNPERSQIVNEEYHDWIVNQIYEFTFNKPEDCKEDCEDDCNGDCEDENNNENNSEENEVVNV